MNDHTKGGGPGERAGTRTGPHLERMLRGPIMATLVRLSAPNIAVAAAMTMATIADAWFVSRIGVTALASLALVFPVQALMQMMSAGAMGGGVSSAVARALGAGKPERADAVVVHAVIIALAMAGIYVWFGAVLAWPLFALAGGSGAVLEGAARAGENASVVAAIRLLILTGARRDEILSLRWEHVDFERGCLCLPDSKTGAKTLSLGTPALELLAGLPRIEDNPYVLPGARSGRHHVGLGKAWRRLRAEAGLSDVRLHDLRHSYASMGAGLNESLHVIGALLGHKDTATTQRYAHLSDDPVRAAADRISGHLAAAMAGKSGEVVPLRWGGNPEIA